LVKNTANTWCKWIWCKWIYVLTLSTAPVINLSPVINVLQLGQTLRAGTFSIEMARQGHRRRGRGQLDWLFVLVNEVAIHPGSLFLRTSWPTLLQPHAGRKREGERKIMALRK
jgi:hypothetical protein